MQVGANFNGKFVAIDHPGNTLDVGTCTDEQGLPNAGLVRVFRYNDGARG